MTGSTAGPRSFGLFTASDKNPLRADTRLHARASNDVPYSKKLALISEREGEDAVITGGTRSLHRRLLALNLRELKPVSTSRPGHESTDATPLSA